MSKELKLIFLVLGLDDASVPPDVSRFVVTKRIKFDVVRGSFDGNTIWVWGRKCNTMCGTLCTFVLSDCKL